MQQYLASQLKGRRLKSKSSVRLLEVGESDDRGVHNRHVSDWAAVLVERFACDQRVKTEWRRGRRK